VHSLEPVARFGRTTIPHRTTPRDEIGLNGDADLLELSYRFAGELVDVEQMLGQRPAFPGRRGIPWREK